MAIISIVIPAYNVENYINDCISSWVNQTFRDIEIIVVDDASTDCTSDILKQWHKKDSRVKVLTMTENKGAFIARKVGVEATNGKYIMFSDAGDTAISDSCEILYREMKKNPVDILHFNANIINVCGANQDDIKNLEYSIKPYVGKLYGDSVLLGCFYNTKYRSTLWNKFFSADICKKSIETQEGERILVAEDALAYFYIAYYAKSYRGFEGKGLYNYHYGHGGLGGKRIDLSLLRNQCSSSYAVLAMESFATTHNLSDKYFNAIRQFKKEMIDCSVQWLTNSLTDDEKSDGFDILMRSWSHCDVIAKFANKKYDKYRLSKQLKNTKALKYQPRKIKTIASYYRRTGIGGIERVLSSLSKIWVEMGFHVILLTDEKKNEYEYEMPKEVQIVVLSDYYNTNIKDYFERGELLYSIIKKYQIDIVVYHDWMKESVLWDEMIIKSTGAAFILHCHGTFIMEFHSPQMGLSNIVAPAFLADAVVTLSETDKVFWSNFNGNAFNVVNPFTYHFEDWKQSECKGKDILWLARISPEKRPFESLRIMKEVVKSIPDARLHIVGASAKPEYEKKLKKAVSRMGLSKNVLLYGAQTDVMQYYYNASVFLMTSVFEGFSMTLQESMLAGLPVVMYDLPYLTITKDNPGIISVSQEDAIAASSAIVELLSDGRKRKKIGNAARKFIEQYRDYDFKGIWKKIFDSVSSENAIMISKEQSEMMGILVVNQGYGFNKTKDATSYAHRKAIKFAVKFLKIKDKFSKR